MTVGNIGVDFELALESEEKLISEKNCKVTQVCLKLSSPWVGAAVNILRKRGFFLGGILPRWFDKDGFFMQKTVDRPNCEGINLLH